ncbi:hypothetical protein E3N88_13338 [Mikania micrantha]|uniref:RING-type E3 ubiquitin transferase n=1 Tax=Mikania micrantha TaxID=192012 RepID=A0A5N6P9F0_9ASTR|nr:hypothetical protein E3N88_13338 [Mikania micrantha]
MNTTTTAGGPPYTATDDTQNTKGTIPEGIQFFLVIFFILIIVCYGCYISKRSLFSQSPTPSDTIISLANHHHVGAINHHIKFSQGLDDDVLVSFPTFVYSDVMIRRKGEAYTDANVSSCSICLDDYKPSDVLRMLPECEHLFHLSCIDTWLKVHPTCPVCRSML